MSHNKISLPQKFIIISKANRRHLMGASKSSLDRNNLKLDIKLLRQIKSHW